MSAVNPYPRQIKPELVNVGDDIEVVLPAVDGAVHSIRGKVGALSDHNRMRYIMTAEGYILLAWEPGVNSGVKITLHSREPYRQLPLFESEIGEVRERIA